MNTVLAVDPGLDTGWVLFRPLDPLTIHVARWGEIVGVQEFCDFAWELKQQGGLDYIVCEDFVPRKDRVLTWRPESLWIIGMLRWMMTPQAFGLQQVADAKAWGTESKIKPYTQNKGVGYQGEGHAQMALRHALLWTATRWDGS